MSDERIENEMVEVEQLEGRAEGETEEDFEGHALELGRIENERVEAEQLEGQPEVGRHEEV